MRTFAEFLDLLADPVWQAEHELRLATYEAARTDPWRWYCRTCGAEGEAEKQHIRDRDAYRHIISPEGHGRPAVRVASHGRLKHVW